MIVDAHTHIFESGRGGPFDLPSSAEDLVRDMDAAGIDMSVVLPLPGVATNDHVARECARRPDRLRALYTPEFDQPSTTISKMAAFFDAHGPAGLKLHPRVQGVTVNDSIMDETLAWAEDRGTPALFDVFPWGPMLDNPAIQPMAYHHVAQKRPKLRLILAHGGGFRLMDGFMVAKSNPNVWLDLSVTPVYFKGSSLVGDCAFVCKRLPAGRVLYGSDFPYVRVGESYEHARQWLDAPAELAAEFFGGAAQRIFSL
jgi:predicted TIM-barrel fold metal-dependent hydrolase